MGPMVVIGLLLLLQDSAVDYGARNLAVRLTGLCYEPIKNAEKLDRGFQELQDIVDNNPEFPSRSVVLARMARIALRTGRAEEAFDCALETLEYAALSPDGPAEEDYSRAVYCAFLAMKPKEGLALLETMAGDFPESSMVKKRAALERDARRIGQRGSSVSLPSIDKTRFSWGRFTKGKVAVLYFCDIPALRDMTFGGEMVRLGKKYKDIDDVATVIVSLDVDKVRVSKFAKAVQETWTVLCDYKGFECRPARAYKITSGSAVVITDSKGRIRQGPGYAWDADKIVQDLRMEAFWLERRKKAAREAKAKEAKEAKEAKSAKGGRVAKDAKVEKKETSPPSSKITARPLRSSTAGVRWVFHLENGGKLRVVSYEEKDGDYVIKLAAGATTIPTYKVARIVPFDPKKP